LNHFQGRCVDFNNTVVWAAIAVDKHDFCLVCAEFKVGYVAKLQRRQACARDANLPDSAEQLAVWSKRFYHVA